MDRDIEYSLVFIALLQKLETLDYDGFSLPAERRTSTRYSITKPSVQYGTNAFPLITWDIEISKIVTEPIIEKWKKLAATSSFLYLVVAEETKQQAEKICAEHLSNWLVFSYRIEAREITRKAIITFL